MVKPVIMTNRPIKIKKEGMMFSPWNHWLVESLRKQADGIMKIRGVALRTPWMIQKKAIKVNKPIQNNWNQHWLNCYNLRSTPKVLRDSRRPKILMCKLQLWALLCPHAQLLKAPYRKGHWIPPAKMQTEFVPFQKIENSSFVLVPVCCRLKACKFQILRLVNN